MRLLLVVLLTFMLLSTGGCAALGTTGSVSAISTCMAMLHNALALAQVGYQDYALLSKKDANPQTLAAMQLIDNQLNYLGALAYNTAQPSEADILKAQEALKKVEEAKAQIAVTTKPITLPK